MSSLFREGVLDGRVALVTGGGTGIGAAITRELTRQGARVMIASRKDDRIQRAAAALSEELAQPVLASACDIRDREAVSELVQRCQESLGPVDILVNNGGGQFISPAESISPRGWDAVLATNLTGSWNLTQAVAKAGMIKRGGRIINVTMLTERGFPGMAHSCAARSGVEGLTKSLAVEWSKYGILVNCVAPGVIASGGLKKYPNAELLLRETQREIPLKRLGSCEEVAWMVAFLAGPGGAYITGQTLSVCGGRSLWGKTWPVPDPPELPPIELPDDPGAE